MASRTVLRPQRASSRPLAARNEQIMCLRACVHLSMYLRLHVWNAFESACLHHCMFVCFSVICSCLSFCLYVCTSAGPQDYGLLQPVWPSAWRPCQRAPDRFVLARRPSWPSGAQQRGRLLIPHDMGCRDAAPRRSRPCVPGSPGHGPTAARSNRCLAAFPSPYTPITMCAPACEPPTRRSPQPVPRAPIPHPPQRIDSPSAPTTPCPPGAHLPKNGAGPSHTVRGNGQPPATRAASATTLPPTTPTDEATSEHTTTLPHGLSTHMPHIRLMLGAPHYTAPKTCRPTPTPIVEICSPCIPSPPQPAWAILAIIHLNDNTSAFAAAAVISPGDAANHASPPMTTQAVDFLATAHAAFLVTAISRAPPTTIHITALTSACADDSARHRRAGTLLATLLAASKRLHQR